jgi:cell division protein ZapA
MAEIQLTIGGHVYPVACREGDEPHLRKLGEIVDRKTGEARQAVGNASEVRQLLLAALLLADEAEDGRSSRAAEPAKAAPDDAQTLETLADNLEALAARLEA